MDDLAANMKKFQVLRDGRWNEEEAAILVPGDIISIKLGDIIPADARLLDGDPLKIDQVNAFYFILFYFILFCKLIFCFISPSFDVFFPECPYRRVFTSYQRSWRWCVFWFHLQAR